MAVTSRQLRITRSGTKLTASGRTVRTWTRGAAYSLTVANIHTYVIAGDTAVLVHNCDFGPGVADIKYDKHVLGLDDAGNATR
nr:hypothetical protein [Salinispora arenicola]